MVEERNGLLNSSKLMGKLRINEHTRILNIDTNWLVFMALNRVLKEFLKSLPENVYVYVSYICDSECDSIKTKSEALRVSSNAIAIIYRDNLTRNPRKGLPRVFLQTADNITMELKERLMLEESADNRMFLNYSQLLQRLPRKPFLLSADCWDSAKIHAIDGFRVSVEIKRRFHYQSILESILNFIDTAI